MNNETVYVGAREGTSLMVGDMGVKSVFVGSEQIYERSGGYFYINLITEDKGDNN